MDSRAERDDLGYLLARASQRWDALLQERCHALGFSEVRPAFGSVLLPLFTEDGLRMGELAIRSNVSKQNMTTLVREVERAGLVRRTPDEVDRRAQRVWLTPRARQFESVGARILTEMSILAEELVGARSLAVTERCLRELMSLPLGHYRPPDDDGGVRPPDP